MSYLYVNQNTYRATLLKKMYHSLLYLGTWEIYWKLDTNVKKLQIIQNTALKIATGCTRDTNIQHQFGLGP